MEKKSNVLREELDLLKERINMARTEQSEIRFRMDNLIEGVKEKFNLELTEIYKEYLKHDFSATETRTQLDHQNGRVR